MKKLFALILCGLLASSAMVSCSSGDKTQTEAGDTVEKGDTVADTGETTVTETTELSDAVPELDFGGAEFRVASSQNSFYNGQMNRAEMTGDVLDDAIYSRNREAESRFNVVISEHSDKADPVLATVRNTVMAGDEGFHSMMIADRMTFSYALEGFLYNYSDIPYIDLEKPYWAKTGNDEMTINGKLYGAFGDVSLPGLDYTHLLAFNGKMLDNYALQSPYDYVENNEWTYDNFISLARTVVTDVNGDGAWGEEDIYGHVGRGPLIFPIFWVASDVTTVRKDSDGMPYFSAAGDEKLISVYDKLCATLADENIWYAKTENSNTYYEKTKLFQNDQSLFADLTFFTVGQMRDMDSDFGIVPYPKWDEAQEKYRAWVEGGCQTISVPTNTPDLEMSGALLEALCCMSYKEVIPAYYEITLKQKYTRDSVSAEMFDIIRESRAFDLGDTFWFNSIRGVFGDLFPKNRDLTSFIEKNRQSIDTVISDAAAFLK